jgi:hypothetical protein
MDVEYFCTTNPGSSLVSDPVWRILRIRTDKQGSYIAGDV